MDYTALRQRIVGFLDEIRRETTDPVFDKALQRVSSISVWVLDQNRYKTEMDIATIRDAALQEIDLYSQKMFVDGFGDENLYRAVVKGRSLVAEVFGEIVADAATEADGETTPAAG